MPQEQLGPFPGGNSSSLDVSVAAVVIKPSPGTLFRVSVNTPSSVSVSACYDALTTATGSTGIEAANLIAEIPINGTGVTELEWPCANGIAIVPGSGANLSISYE